MSDHDEPLAETVQRKLNFFQTLKAILWAMFGVRKGSGLKDDIAKLNPVHVIFAGLLFGILFVVSLVVLAQVIVSNMTA
ncbi:MAG: DUF2970 domain-containing protein [Orrella sp.]